MSVESRITIDRDRNMIVPEELRKRIIQYDHNIETIGIDCPRYWDGRDLSEMKILVNYVVDKSKGICSSYLVESVTVDDAGDKETDMMHFDWIVKEDATQKDGLLPLFVCAQVIDELGNTENHWSSRLNEEIDIGKSYKCLQNIVDMYPSIIGQILAKLDALENGSTSDGTSGGTSDGSTTSAREILLQNSGTAIQWQYSGDDTWTDLVLLEDIKGDKGDKGDTGKTAYEYAKDGGYAGTEEEFAEKLATEYAEVIQKVEKTANDTAAELQPNTLYVFPEMAELSLTFADQEETDVAAEYHCIFTSGATATTLTLPDTINVPSGFTVEANKVYELSVLEGNLTYQSWAVS